MRIDHRHFMSEAIKRGVKNEICPFGAILVDKTTHEIVGEGWNQTKEKKDLTSHGEMEAIRDCIERDKTKTVVWSNLILYTTAEPCAMCQGAVLWTGIGKVVFGSSIPFLKTLPLFANAIDIRAQTISYYWTKKDQPCEIIPGILKKECEHLFRDADESSRPTEFSHN